jgi:hypothetical protein
MHAGVGRLKQRDRPSSGMAGYRRRAVSEGSRYPTNAKLEGQGLPLPLHKRARDGCAGCPINWWVRTAATAHPPMTSLLRCTDPVSPAIDGAQCYQ